VCKNNSIHEYCVKSNLIYWFSMYASATAINWLSRQNNLIDNYTMTWVAGSYWGILLMWSMEIGREWLKTKLLKS
jgi:hypothetical protein